MASLLLHGELQSVVVRIHNVLPNAKRTKVRVQTAGRVHIRDLTAKLAPEVIRSARSLRQTFTRDPVYVLRSEQLVSSRTDVVCFHDQLRHDFMLNAEVKVVYVRIANPFWENNSSKSCEVLV